MRRNALVMFVLAALVMSVAASAQVNLLNDPQMESIATGTWAKNGTATAATGALWNSLALGWSNGHGASPNYYAVLAKRSGASYSPNDNTTQVRGYFTQKVNGITAGIYTVSGWYKIVATANRTSMWDGVGGVDQCARLAVELHYTDGTANKWFWSNKIETLTPTWTQVSYTVDIPVNVDYVNFYAYEWMVDQWVTAADMTYVAWDDLGLVKSVPEPGSLLAVLCGLSGLFGLARRRGR